MKVTLRNIYGASNILGVLVEQQLPIRIAFRLTRLITRLNEEYSTLDQTRQKLIDEYGTKIKESDPDNPSFTFSEEDQQNFTKQFNELLDEEVEIEWEGISIDDLGSDITLSVKELNAIGFIFREFEDLVPTPESNAKEEVATA